MTRNELRHATMNQHSHPIQDAGVNGLVAPRRPTSAADWFALIALAALLVSQMTVRQFPDPDMYHEIALWRLAIEQGEMPLTDPFAYTPTNEQVIHHEWGTGAVLHYVIVNFGESGLLTLKYTLVGALGLLCVWCARRRGADWSVICVLTPLAILLGHIGLTTVRAQVFSLVLLAALLLMLDLDRQGKRWWIVPWLVLHVLWLNLHAGFVVGMALCAAHWIEQVIRTRKPQWHLIGTGIAMAGLVFVNPYGWRFVPFIWQSVGMDRPMIPEWWPLWRLQGSDALPFYVFIFSAFVLLYVVYRAGWKKLPGLLIVLLCAYASLRHVRHASLFAVAWACYVPSFVQATQLGDALSQFWNKHRVAVGIAFACLAALCLAMMPGRPWQLHVPVSLADEKRVGTIYPIGAAHYLRDINFRGNVMTSFTNGAYLSWKLFPDVKVSVDGRYEVAYREGVAEEIIRFYAGRDEWRETLDRYPTDIVLVPRHYEKLSRLIAEQSGWSRFYRDDAVDLYARPGLDLPIVDRSGAPLAVDFP